MKIKKEKEYVAEDLYAAVDAEYEKAMSELVGTIKSELDKEDDYWLWHKNIGQIGLEIYRINNIVEAIYHGEYTIEELRALLNESRKFSLITNISKILRHKETREKDMKELELSHLISDLIAAFIEDKQSEQSEEQLNLNLDINN
jgi:hypothetical protein